MLYKNVLWTKFPRFLYLISKRLEWFSYDVTSDLKCRNILSCFVEWLTDHTHTMQLRKVICLYVCLFNRSLRAETNLGLISMIKYHSLTVHIYSHNMSPHQYNRFEISILWSFLCFQHRGVSTKPALLQKFQVPSSKAPTVYSLINAPGALTFFFKESGTFNRGEIFSWGGGNRKQKFYRILMQKLKWNIYK